MLWLKIKQSFLVAASHAAATPTIFLGKAADKIVTRKPIIYDCYKTRFDITPHNY